MFERRLYHHVDWGLLTAIVALCGIGLAQIYSASGGWTQVVEIQVYAILLGVVALLVCLAVDYRSLADKSHFIYVAIIALLLYVLLFGAVRGGSRRWIDLGALNMQPSEFAKAAHTLGNMLGVDKIHKWAERLGLTGKTGIDLPNEQDSLVPSTEWKLQRFNEKWYAGETISVAIGQGQVAVTPASLATMIATVANGGLRVTPHIVRAVDEGSGWKPATPPVGGERTPFRPETLAALHDGLWMVVNANGTGGRARIPGRDVAGKTGTAQVISNEGRLRARGSEMDLRDHGWFIFFAPKDNPEIAGVVFAEHGEHGYLGAPIAKHVMETYFAKKQGLPLPELAPKPDAAPAPEPDPDATPLDAPAVAGANPKPPTPNPNVRG